MKVGRNGIKVGFMFFGFKRYILNKPVPLETVPRFFCPGFERFDCELVFCKSHYPDRIQDDQNHTDFVDQQQSEKGGKG